MFIVMRVDMRLKRSVGVAERRQLEGAGWRGGSRGARLCLGEGGTASKQHELMRRAQCPPARSGFGVCSW